MGLLGWMPKKKRYEILKRKFQKEIFGKGKGYKMNNEILEKNKSELSSTFLICMIIPVSL